MLAKRVFVRHNIRNGAVRAAVMHVSGAAAAVTFAAAMLTPFAARPGAQERGFALLGLALLALLISP